MSGNQVAWDSPMVFVTPAASATPDYSSGDVIGGILTLTQAVGHVGTGVLKTLVVRDNANQKQPITFLLFHTLPTGTYTDNAAFSWGASDFAKCFCRVAIGASDYATIDSKAIGVLEVACNLYNLEATRNIYAIAVAGGTINLGGADDLVFGFGVLRD